MLYESHHKIPKRFWRHNSKCIVWVRGGEILWHFCLGLCVPLELEGTHNAILLFYEVDFFLVVGTPKIHIGITAGVVVSLDTLAYHKILPQHTDVVKDSNRKILPKIAVVTAKFS